MSCDNSRVPPTPTPRASSATEFLVRNLPNENDFLCVFRRCGGSVVVQRPPIRRGCWAWAPCGARTTPPLRTPPRTSQVRRRQLSRLFALKEHLFSPARSVTSRRTNAYSSTRARIRLFSLPYLPLEFSGMLTTPCFLTSVSAHYAATTTAESERLHLQLVFVQNSTGRRLSASSFGWVSCVAKRKLCVRNVCTLCEESRSLCLVYARAVLVCVQPLHL